MQDNLFKILALDGGGSKGIYSLGILFEMEAKLGTALVNHFDLFYCCSTGAIIAAALAKGKRVREVKEMYLREIPKIMKVYRASTRTKLLHSALLKEFGNETSEVFQKPICIISTATDAKIPKIFKSNVGLAHGRKSSFDPFFGYTITDSLIASCAAFPFFEKGKLIDGGFCASNPTLFAIIDALKAIKIPNEEIVLINIGTGNFPLKITLQLVVTFLMYLPHIFSIKVISDIMVINSNTMSEVARLLLSDIRKLRINDTFTDKYLQTNLLECDSKVLMELFEQGRKSFGKYEKDFETAYLS